MGWKITCTIAAFCVEQVMPLGRLFKKNYGYVITLEQREEWNFSAFPSAEDMSGSDDSNSKSL